MVAGGENVQDNGSAILYRRPAASVNSDFARETARLVIQRFRDGTLNIEILKALLRAVGLEPES